ncbi:GMC family oxidoreductase [Nocardia transvalensis]|uniref:GMC family oxidoreductase n=1 Tax=Nocardia transvalensis TaxID=37333 RepID=UPI001E5A9029|nr:GMC oxidoreductase [Nocardia transvalensis]
MQTLINTARLAELGLPVPGNTFMLPVSTVPTARGSIRLSSPDPHTPPVIDPNYLGVDSDIQRLLHGIQRARDLVAAAPLQPWFAREVLPGPDITSEADLRTYLADNTMTYWHPVGTCAMGVGPDAVVAPDLRVRGLDGLRVADASIMPTITSANPMVPTIMIGEKAADLIRGNQQQPKSILQSAATR